MTLQVALVILGAALVVAGVAFMFWPLALVLTGAGLVAVGIFVDLEALDGKPDPTSPR